MFLKTEHDLGIIKAGSKNNMEFPYDESVSLVTRITGCDCSSSYNKAKERMVVLVFTAMEIPKHLSTTKWVITKSYEVEAVLKDGTIAKQKISFKAIIVK